MTRISMPRSSSRQPDGGAKAIPLFDPPGPSPRPDVAPPRAARTAAVKAGRRPPRKAARSGLERREHAAPITSGRNPIISLDEPQSIFETAAEPVLGPRGARTRGQPPQDEDSFLMPSIITSW